MVVIQWIISGYSYLANAGVDSARPENRKTKKLMNILCLIWYHASILFVISNYLISPSSGLSVALHAVISIIVFGLVHYLNVRDHIEMAKLLFIGFNIIQNTLVSILTKPGELVELFTISFPLVAVVLYDRFSAHLAFLLVSMGAALASHHWFQDYNLPGIVLVVIPMIFVTAFLVVVYLKRMGQEKEKLLAIERNKALADKKIIEVQAAELSELHKFKDHFFANISHEIRTPLTLISGYARRLNDRTDPNLVQQYSKIMADKSADIKELIDSIIDLSKLDAQKLTLNKASVNLSKLLQKTYSDFRDLFTKQTIEIQISIPDQTVFVNCDAVLMTRVINNLMTNALKFTPPEGIVRLNMKVEPKLTIEVYNTGIGIPEADLARIFERFYQSDNDITRSQGSGIGLAITQGIIELHGYRIWAESEVNQYARFVISIPFDQFWLGEALSLPPLTEISSNDLPPTPPKLGSKRILLVEDNPDVRKYIREIKTMDEYAVLEANHGGEALELLSQQSVDLIITDYMMPHTDGLELVKQLRQQAYQQPVLVITAQIDQQNKLDMLRLGIDGYLTKPFLEEELVMMIRRALEHEEARRTFVQQGLSPGEIPLLPDELAEFNRNLRAIIEQNISNQQFSVTDICKDLDITERTLYRKVKELSGCTPAKLISERRLLRAKAYYDQGTYRSVRQLAQAVGYKNSTYFAEKFRTHFGIDL
ncbi:hybrid sensor histidine kinase/response regulator transcription factor [Tunicatimonas pelagia]|uniref:hybrid sensor histidine kinase/response regulator transcription factor n=1 Tax=Tunicatimonas pelagia TaxID=931531 RepID=UPI0026664EB8|nr:response regulator [Tunicatimonas pelagia]WKN43120.1 response regulator [Tunicatimonas pelagia]